MDLTTLVQRKGSARANMEVTAIVCGRLLRLVSGFWRHVTLCALAALGSPV